MNILSFLCEKLRLKKVSHINCYGDFVAIDFETATSQRNSACALGAVKVHDWKVGEMRTWLFRPPGNVYSDFNIGIHHICAADTEFCFPIAYYFEEIKSFLGNQIIVAHNAVFDLDVLFKSFESAGCVFPDGVRYFCTSALNGNQKLLECCKLYDVKLEHHHQAISDALACAEIFLQTHVESAPSIYHHVISEKVIVTQRHEKKQDVDLPSMETTFHNLNNIFDGQNVVVTGTFKLYPDRDNLKDILKGYGASIDSAVLKRTDIAIIGYNPGPSKMKKIKQLRSAGQHIKIIKENDLMYILHSLQTGQEIMPLTTADKKRLSAYPLMLIQDYPYGSNPFEWKCVKVIGKLLEFPDLEIFAGLMKRVYHAKIVKNVRNAQIVVIGSMLTSDQLTDLFQIEPEKILRCTEQKLYSFLRNIDMAERSYHRFVHHVGNVEILIDDSFCKDRYIKPGPNAADPPESSWPILEYPES